MSETLAVVVRCRELLEDGDLPTLATVLAGLEEDLAARALELAERERAA